MLSFASEIKFEELFKANFPRLCQVAYRVLGDIYLAEDVVQEVFVKIWQKKDDLDIKQTPEAYLSRAVVNASLNLLEKNKYLAKNAEITENQGSCAITVQHDIEAEELSAKLNETIASLPTQCRIVFSLSRFDGMPNQEIADHLGITKKTVENQLNKALKKLRETTSHLINLAIKLSPLILCELGFITSELYVHYNAHSTYIS